MNKKEFLQSLQEELEWETPLELNTNFKELPEWNSLSAMVLISYVSDNFNVSLNGEQIKEMSTIESLIKRIGIAKFS